jgi:ribulose-phosphate 3-epimerase
LSGGFFVTGLLLIFCQESNMVKIAPSILAADFSKLGDEIKAVEDAGADWIHVDVMDGHFVPNITIGPGVVESIRKVTKLPLDVHLMIADADRYLKDFADAGADILTVHVEACPHLNRTLQAIQELKVRAGVVLNPATPLSSLEEVLLDIDMVLLMSVNPGFGGQQFIQSVLDKILNLKEIMGQFEHDFELEVDGGVNEDNAADVQGAGANVLVAGSAIFKSKDYTKAILALRGEG